MTILYSHLSNTALTADGSKTDIINYIFRAGELYDSFAAVAAALSGFPSRAVSTIIAGVGICISTVSHRHIFFFICTVSTLTGSKSRITKHIHPTRIYNRHRQQSMRDFFA